MENVVLIVHLVLAVFLIAVVLLQRSEGGALGIGGGGGGLVSSRGAATALQKVTWGLAAAFIATSLALTVIAATNTTGRSVVEGVSTGVPGADDTPSAPAGGGFSLPNLPSSEKAPAAGDAPAAPAPTTPPAAD